MESLGFAIVAAAALAFALVSGRIERSVVTGPMVFVLLGWGLGPGVSDVVQVELDAGSVHQLLEVTLALVLFTDASRIDLRLLRREHDLPERLLMVGLPLCVVAGTVAAVVLFPSLSWIEAALLAAVLAPTDAALGQAVVSFESVPVRIRQALNVESGLNDGIALPAVLVLVSLAAVEGGHAMNWIRFVALQLGLGPLVGVAIGLGGGRLLLRAWRAGAVSAPFLRLSALILALLALSLAELVGGNGFIAAFVAGLALGNGAREICPSLYEFGEAEGQLLTLATFFVFGALDVPAIAAGGDGRAWIYAGLSLTVVRMLPVALSLLDKRLRPSSVLFLGWFGPRGLASILFGMVVLEEARFPNRDAILAVVSTTVLLSVFAHGMTAAPGARAYARRLGRYEQEDIEGRGVSEMPLRIPGKRT